MLPLLFDDSLVFTGQLTQLLLVLCEEVNSNFSSKIRESLINKDWARLVEECDISPNSYLDAQTYYKDAQIVGLVKKYPFWDIKTSTKHVAMKTFIACEHLCTSTNNRIWSRKDFNSFRAENAILYIAQSKISSILGEIPSLEDLKFEFGPGAAYGVKYNTSALHKLGSTLDVSENCYELAESFLSTCPGWRPNSDFMLVGPYPQPKLNLVVGDRLSFVPKTAKTDRPIAIGPLINVLLQKGIGRCIRQKLKPYVNLNNAQDYHRAAALKASMDGSLCTIDLKNASDTIAYATVQTLLPPEWFELLDACRSQSYEIEGNVYRYSKFSAMGNGYTFELESLIFYSLAFAVCKYYGFSTETLSVFGDDIIAPTEAYMGISNILLYLGFEVNSNKSFFSGPFRESCGGDFFNGIDVRPFYLKDKLTYRTLFLFHNFLVRKGWQFLLPSTYRYVRKLIGKANIAYYKTWNTLDDGALLDPTVIAGSYNSIKSYYKNRQPNVLKRTYGVSLILYRLQLTDYQSETDYDFRNHFTRKTRLKHKCYRYVHF